MKELELFDYLKDKLYPDLVKSEGEYDSFDCISESTKSYIELKCRNTHYLTLLIEFAKYTHLIDNANALEYTPYYVNSTPIAIYSFDLSVLPEPVWEEKWLPSTTEFTNKSNRTKLVGFLSIERAVTI